MGSLIVHFDRKNKVVNLLDAGTHLINSKWENCELVTKEDGYHVLDIDQNYEIIAMFPIYTTTVFYTIPSRTYTIDEIDWSDGTGY